MKLISALIASFLSLAPARSNAQTPLREQETARARELMESPLVKEKAWGVYFAGRLHSEELNKLLVEEIRSAGRFREAVPDSEGYALVSVLFDAAIEERLNVPGELLEPFFKQWPGPVLMLLSWSANSEELLLRLRWQPGPDVNWLAVNNVLYKRKSLRWYAAMLNEIHLSHEIVVSDSGSAAGDPRPLYGGGIGDGFRKMPPGFPPVALFSLQTSGFPGALLLAEGPTSMYLARSINVSDRPFMTGSTVSFVDRRGLLDGYLALLASEPLEETKHWLHRETQLRYMNNTSFYREVARLGVEQETEIRRLIQAAARQGFPVPDIELGIMPKVIDRRANQVPPLPAVNPWVFKLR